MDALGPTTRWHVALLAATAGAATLLLSGCQGHVEAENRLPKPRVVVVAATPMNVPIIVGTNGVTRALSQVSIRARVKGFLKEKHFQEGSNVKEGQLLFVIDEEPFKVELQQAQAKLASTKADLQKAQESKAREVSQSQLRLDEAELQLAVLDERRQAGLLAKKAITKAEYDQTDAHRKKAAAQVDADKAHLEQAIADYATEIAAASAQVKTAEAEVRNAEIDLSYCRMTAPISGRIGEVRVKLGNLVGGDESTELATIQQLDPMGVDLRPSARNLPQITAAVKDHILFSIYVQGERKHPYQARTVFLDNQVDPGTSTVLVRCELPNPDESVLPGDYVFAEAQVGEYHDKIVVPERAVMEGQAGASVYLVDSKGQIAVASVKELDTYQGLRVIDSGLAAGDKVVVEGVQLVRPGMEVQVEETTVKLPAPAEAADRPAPAASPQPPAKPTPPPKPQ